MDGIWRMLNQEIFNPHFNGVKDYVLASGQTHTIGEFVEEAFKVCKIEPLLFNGTPLNHPSAWDHSLDMYCYKKEDGVYPSLVVVDKQFFRPAEVDVLLGDASNIIRELGWTPKSTFQNLVKKMVYNDFYVND
jgi:GDPmannose 4,6-dehydratase